MARHPGLRGFDLVPEDERFGEDAQQEQIRAHEVQEVLSVGGGHPFGHGVVTSALVHEAEGYRCPGTRHVDVDRVALADLVAIMIVSFS